MTSLSAASARRLAGAHPLLQKRFGVGGIRLRIEKPPVRSVQRRKRIEIGLLCANHLDHTQ